jgi:hypothetical protein
VRNQERSAPWSAGALTRDVLTVALAARRKSSPRGGVLRLHSETRSTHDASIVAATSSPADRRDRARRSSDLEILYGELASRDGQPCDFIAHRAHKKVPRVSSDELRQRQMKGINMVKKSATFAVTLGLLTALLLGSTATASATGRTSCSNGINNIVTCNRVTSNVVIKIIGKRALTTGEISILEDSLNNTSIDVVVLKNVVIETYKSFNPSIDINVGDVKVCIASYCR